MPPAFSCHLPAVRCLRLTLTAAATLFLASTLASSPDTNIIFGADGPVYAIYQKKSFNSSRKALYVGGRFSRIGNIKARNAAAYINGQWYPIGNSTNGIEGEVNAIAAPATGGYVYFGGLFTVGTNIQNLTAWNGTEFIPVGNPNGRVRALTGYEESFPVVAAGGDFTQANGTNGFLIKHYEFDNTIRVFGAETMPNGNIHALEYTAEAIVAGGSFTRFGSTETGAAVYLVTEPGRTNTGVFATSLLGFTKLQGTVTSIGYDPSVPRFIYVGGAFNYATNGGNSAGMTIARWDNIAHAFSEMSGGLRGGTLPLVHALFAEGRMLYAGGRFQTAGGYLCNNIALWDGTSWFPSAAVFGGGINGSVYALGGITNEIFIGGAFDSADYLPAENLVAWNGGSRTDFTLPGVNSSQLPGQPGPVNTNSFNSRMIEIPGFTREVTALTASPTHIYAAGYHIAGDNSLETKISRFDGRTWRLVGEVMQNTTAGSINDLHHAGGLLYAAGLFTDINGVTSPNIAVRSGESWEALGNGLDGEVFEVATDRDDIYAVGFFDREVSNFAISLNGIARYERGSLGPWQPLGRGLFVVSNGIRRPQGGTEVVAHKGSIYVSGAFTHAENEDRTLVPTGHLARWDGSSWHAVPGVTFTLGIRDLASDGQNLYVSGIEYSLNGNLLRGVLKWDGTNWTHLGGGGGPLVVHGQQLYAGGSGGVPLSKFDGSSWRGIGLERDWSYAPEGSEIFPRTVFDLALRGDELFFGGRFTKAVGAPANYVAHYDATPRTYDEWRALHFSPEETFSAALPEADPDNDGVSNADEFSVRTDPRNGESVFELTPVHFPLGELSGGEGAIQGFYPRILLQFEAQANMTYTVQYKDGVTLPWQLLQQVSARAVDRTVSVFDDDHGAGFRIYRVVTPALP